jgi:hypothetical protein
LKERKITSRMYTTMPKESMSGNVSTEPDLIDMSSINCPAPPAIKPMRDNAFLKTNCEG